MLTETKLNDHRVSVERVDNGHSNKHHVVTFTELPYVWEQWVLALSDVHVDNPKCRRDMLQRDLKLAKERGAIILSIGDFYCAMQGKSDKRGSKDDLLPEMQGSNYLNRLTKYGFDQCSTALENWAVMTRGNHETSILKHYEEDLLESLTDKLRDKGGIAQVGDYRGYINLRFKQGTRKFTKVIGYHHGWGGGGHVTQGVNDYAKISAAYQGWDLFFMGHIHRKDASYRRIEEFRAGQGPKFKRQGFFRLGTYKDESVGNGFHEENGQDPRALGGWWFRFYSRGEKPPGFQAFPVEEED